jgi:exodeoxyribonuclease VII large subunit
VTSLTGAVWHDIRTVIERRWPLVEVIAVPCQVQGEGAPGSIVTALRRVERWVAACERDGGPGPAPALTIIARGGGSLEDLWAFNDERVVRAVAAHPVPIVAGVGHEVDVTLVDFAADVRAPTPSAAAELVVPDRADLERVVEGQRRRLDGLVAARVGTLRGWLTQEARVLERLSPSAMLAAARERSGLLLDRATAAVLARITAARRREETVGAGLAGPMAGRLSAARAGLDAQAAALLALGPQATLDRGYAIVRRAGDEAVVRDPAEAPAGTLLSLRVARGTFVARSEDSAEARTRTGDRQPSARPTDRTGR